MTWVPPYATSKCLDRLNESFGGMGMKNGLTHLGIQFWRPSEKGKIKRVDDFKPIMYGYYFAYTMDTKMVGIGI